MTANGENMGAHELIGLKILVNSSSDPTLAGVVGIVRDETKNTLSIETDGKFRTVPKSGTSFLVESPSGEKSFLDGSRLTFRPEDRIKRGVGRWR